MFMILLGKGKNFPAAECNSGRDQHKCHTESSAASAS